MILSYLVISLFLSYHLMICLFFPHITLQQRFRMSMRNVSCYKRQLSMQISLVNIRSHTFYDSVQLTSYFQKYIINLVVILIPWGFPCGSAVKESTCNAGDLDSIPGLGRSPGEGKGYPFQSSGLENSMDCIIHGVTKSQTQLSNFHFTFIYLIGVPLGMGDRIF